jgi:hypothetical protein
VKNIILLALAALVLAGCKERGYSDDTASEILAKMTPSERFDTLLTQESWCVDGQVDGQDVTVVTKFDSDGSVHRRVFQVQFGQWERIGTRDGKFSRDDQMVLTFDDGTEQIAGAATIDDLSFFNRPNGELKVPNVRFREHLTGFALVLKDGSAEARTFHSCIFLNDQE